MLKNNFGIYYKTNIQLLKIFVIGLIIFMCFRTAFLLSFGDLSELKDFKLDLLSAYWVGFRFDASVLAYGFALPFLLNLLMLIIPRAANYYKTVKKVIFWYFLAAFSTYLSLLFMDFCYFIYFHSHFNELFFGIARGETKAVLTSAWTDYPVIQITILIIVIMGLIAWSVRKVLNREYEIDKKKLSFRISFIFITVGVYALALHGSLGTLPISRDKDSYISPNIFINDLTLNGVFSLMDTLSEIKKQRSSAEDFAVSHGKETLQAVNEALFVQTPSKAFLKENPPHVVFVLMESMSSYYLDLHSTQLNLLGTLEKQLPHCITFRNFLPASNGTIQSLEALMVSNLKASLPETQLSHMDKPFPMSSSVALPFSKAGYHTTFITGGNLRFGNLDKFVPRQYFGTVEGNETILSKVKNAQAGDWGSHDEFVFDRIFEKLDKANGIPQFIFALTVSNHTPFGLPPAYKPFPVQIPQDILKNIKTDRDLAVKNFTAYQYANDSLGRFIKRLRASPYADNTIIAITGDHNTRQLFTFSYTQLLQSLGVPLILDVPAKYRPTGKIDTSRFASHKDIFPTLFSLALSEATYFKTGNNLLNAVVPEEEFFALSDTIVMNKYGCILMQDKPFFYRWQENNPDLLQPTSLSKAPALENLFKKGRYYTRTIDYFTKVERIKAELTP